MWLVDARIVAKSGVALQAGLSGALVCLGVTGFGTGGRFREVDSGLSTVRPSSGQEINFRSADVRADDGAQVTLLNE